jgi:enterochelin esterase-like enzyme
MNSFLLSELSGDLQVRKSLPAVVFTLILAIIWVSSDPAFLNVLVQDVEVASPRLLVLKKDIEAGNRAALERFWQDVTKQGTPLVEPVKEADRQVLLTFLWRAKEETRNVVVFGGVAGTDINENQMTRLLDTDLWYKTYKVRDDARFSYSLSLNDSLVPFERIDLKDQKAVNQRISTFKTDPLNPKTYLGLPPTSLVELPGAPPQPWTKRSPDVPAGKIEEKKLKSAILGNERKVWVYTPPGYKTSGEPYGLMVLFDGFAYTLLVPTPVILDNLLAKGLILPMIAIVLDNPTPRSRDDEMPCNARFADFLASEAVPWVRDNYNVTKDANRIIVAGSSYGGLAATFAGFRHPEVFGNVISQSGSFWWKPNGDAEHEWLTRQFVASPRLPVRFYLDIGLMERGPSPDGGPDQVVVNRHMRDVLRAKGYFVHYVEFNGGHEYLSWRGTLSDALLVLAGKGATENKSKPQ